MIHALKSLSCTLQNVSVLRLLQPISTECKGSDQDSVVRFDLFKQSLASSAKCTLLAGWSVNIHNQKFPSRHFKTEYVNNHSSNLL